jgi:hypothetical protein
MNIDVWHIGMLLGAIVSSYRYVSVDEDSGTSLLN